MNPEVKKIWTDALRSGKYERTTGLLARRARDGKWGYCCLGVLCEEAKKAGVELDAQVEKYMDEEIVEYDTYCTVLPPAVREWAGLGDAGNPLIGDRTASHHNDHEKRNFNEIADLIDQYL